MKKTQKHTKMPKNEKQAPDVVETLKAAAGDVAACREIVRKIWDEVLASLNSLAADFKEGPNA